MNKCSCGHANICRLHISLCLFQYFFSSFFCSKAIFLFIYKLIIKIGSWARDWRNRSTHLSLYSSLCAYDCTLFSSIRNLTRWKNEAVTDGGCLRSSTSTGSFDDRHMMCSEHTLCEQHSLSEQSIIPSDKNERFFMIY